VPVNIRLCIFNSTAVRSSHELGLLGVSDSSTPLDVTVLMVDNTVLFTNQLSGTVQRND